MGKRGKIKSLDEKENFENKKSSYEIIKAAEKSKEEAEDIFHWRSCSQHVTYFLLYLMDWDMMGILIYEDDLPNRPHGETEDITSRAAFLHYVILMVICGGPLLFLQTFIGQYTQNGSFCFGDMLPLVYGFGYIILTMSFFDFINHVYYTCNLMDYLFVSLYNSLPPWVACYASYYKISENCFSLRDIDLCPTKANSNLPCFPPRTRILAATLFMQSLNMHGGVHVDHLSVHMTHTVFTLVSDLVHGIMLLILTLLLTFRSIKSFDGTLHIPIYFCIAGSLTILVIALTQPGAAYALGQLKSIFAITSLTDFQAWSMAFRRLMVTLKFGEGGLVLFGCFMRPDEITPYRSLYLSLAFVIIMLFFRFFFIIFSSLLEFKLNLTMFQLQLESEESYIFVLYPVILGIQRFGHLFCFIYFLILSLLSFYSQVIKLIIMEKTITYQFNIASYYGYMRTLICLLGYIGALTIGVTSHRDYFYSYKNCLKIFVIGSVFLQLMIIHLYGTQRLSDDIEFYLHMKVSTYFKFSLIVTPFFCMFELSNWQNFSKSHGFIILMFLSLFTFVPAIIAFLYIIVVFAKKKNIIGLLRPLDKFGPPDIQMRIYRILYTPRLTVKYRRQKEICNHECIKYSEALKTAIEEEINLIKKLIIELESSGINAKENSELISELKKDLEILRKRPKYSV